MINSNPRIYPFTTMGVAGTAYHGPKGRYTVIPKDGFSGRYSVYEAATVALKGTYATREAAGERAAKLSGVWDVL